MQSIVKKAAIVLYYALAAKLPQPPFVFGYFGNGLRRKLCERIFLRCGKKIVVRKNVFFGSGCAIEIGDHSELGLNAYLNRDVKIGDDVLMGQNVTILTTNHEFEDPNVPIHSQGTRERRPVRVGNDVWIGANSVILPGVNIGDGAVIGVGSVVTRDIPSLAVVVGNPARVIRHRGSRRNPEDSLSDLSYQGPTRD